MILYINTVSIYVEDQDKALDFWTQDGNEFLLRSDE